jgi:hypothetical protein
MQAALGRLRGIREVRVAYGGDRFRITILALPERTRVDTLRDVALVARRLGVMPSELEVEVLGAVERVSELPPRRRLTSLSTNRFHGRFTAQVTLELDGDLLRGEISVPEGRRFEMRGVARAVIEAVARLLPFTVQLESVDVLHLGPEQVAVVTMSNSKDILVGSAAVRDDDFEGIVRAALDALNRFVAAPTLRIPDRSNGA